MVFRGMTGSETAQTLARHESTASLQDFVSESARMLKPGGRLCLVHRPLRLADIFEASRRAGLEPKRIVPVVPKLGEASNIILVECIKGAGKGLTFMPQIVIREQDGSFTSDVSRIYTEHYSVK